MSGVKSSDQNFQVVEFEEISLHNKAGQAFGLSGLIFVIHSSLTSETVGKSCLFSGFLSYFLELIKAYGLLVKAHSLFNSVVEF